MSFKHHTPFTSHSPSRLALCCLSALSLSACEGGEASYPTPYAAQAGVSPAPFTPMGGAPTGGAPIAPPVGGEPVGGVPMGGAPMGGAPVGGEPEPGPCGPLAPTTRALFEGAEGTPQGVIYTCAGCHTDPGQSAFVLPAFSATRGVFSDEQLTELYEVCAPYITPGYGAESALSTRMTDSHAFTGFSPNDPAQQAINAWIDALVPCE